MKFKIGKHKINIVKGDKWDFIAGMVLSLASISVGSLIMKITGFYNKWFHVIFAIILTFILYYKFNPIIDEVFRRKDGK